MTKKRWFRFYTDAWLTGTFGLTPNEIAAYITILCELYDQNGFAPLDVDLMSRRCSMRPTSFRKALDVLVKRGKLTLEGGYITSKAVSEEIKSREKLSEKSDESRRNLAEKRNEIKETRRKIPSNIEYRNKNISSSDADDQRSGNPGTSTQSARSRAVDEFIKRRAMRLRKFA